MIMAPEQSCKTRGEATELGMSVISSLLTCPKHHTPHASHISGRTDQSILQHSPACNSDSSPRLEQMSKHSMAAAQPQSSFLTLPPELHLCITSYLPWWDVYALRLACRDLYALLPALTSTWREVPYLDINNRDFGDSFFLASNNLIQCSSCQRLYRRANRYEWKGISRDIWEGPLLPKMGWRHCSRCDYKYRPSLKGRRLLSYD